MDSGNNKQHAFKHKGYFPMGVTWHRVNITGVHGSKVVNVGVGVAYFCMKCVDDSWLLWVAPNSLYNPASPVNLLCVDLFHYRPGNIKTGHRVDFIDECMYMSDGKKVRVKRDSESKLPLVELREVDKQEMREIVNKRKQTTNEQNQVAALLRQEQDATLMAFTRTHLQPMSTDMALKVMNHPLERSFNMTVKHGMLKDMEGVGYLKKVNRADRPDSWYNGKMTNRTVPQVSRRPTKVAMTPGSHVVSDIGYVTIPDRNGNKYWVLYKDLCSQHREVYRMKRKDDIVGVWCQYIADNEFQDLQGTLVCRIRNFITDADASYIEGKVKEVNKNKLIRKWTIAPYTQWANPAESEMRRMMEHAVSMLYNSGLPPSFLLDALDCHTQIVNRLFTPVYHRECDKYKTPYERFHGTKPSFNDMARFGCKTITFVTKDHRAKHDAHSWVGWYLGQTKGMRASRVYRPMTNKVYDRYHTLFDCNVVYGDFMGAMFKSRVEADKQQREYYNSEVKQLLGDRTSNDMVTELLRQMPWALQPLPEEYVHNSTESNKRQTVSVPVDKRKSQRVQAQHDANQIEAQTARHETAVGTAGNHTTTQTASTAAGTTSIHTAQRPQAQRQSSSRDQPAITAAGTNTNTPQTQRQSVQPTPVATAPTTPTITPDRQHVRERALELLRGVPAKVMTSLLSTIELTCSFHSLVEQYQVLDDSLTDDTLLLHAAASAEDFTQYQFIKLCEDTSRRIANSKEPTTDAQVRALDGTVEGKLIREAMLDEVMSLIENGKVVPKHKSTVPDLYEIDGQWVIKFKKTLEGLLERVRSRWVLRGDKQRPYLDYDPNKIYSPVATKTATLSALALAAQYGMLLHVLDVSKAFTVSDIDMPGLHMKVPTCMDEYHPDYAPFGSETTWELLTSLYGLRQASSMYYDTFSKVILAYKDSEGKGYRRSDHDPCVFTKGKLGESDYITFSCHVDDKFIASAEYSSVEELMSVLTKAGFKFTVEPMTKVLGMQVQYTKYDKTVSGSGKVVIDHDMYITDSFDEIKVHFPPSTHSPLSIPMSDQAHKEREPEGEVEFDKARYKLFRTILGKLSHCTNFTHPEIAVAVSVVSQKMANPSQRDLEKAFNILRYLLGTVGKESAKLTLKHNPRFAQGGKSRQNPVHMCCDADLANCFETRRSRTGYCCFLFGMLVGWCSRRQPAVSLSTCESEYVAMSAAAQFGIWYKGLITDMGLELAYYEPIVILSDNKSAINISQSPVTVINKYSKHVQQKIHWFKEYIRNGTIRILFIPGDNNPADLFTKCLAKSKFIPYRDVVLQGDNRELRKISGLSCITRVLSLDAPRGISMDASECNCHNGSFFCFDTAQFEVLLHATSSMK